jgi:DNA-nicking Smr family endonuclease
MTEPFRTASRPRAPSKAELELWSAVTADVRPFRFRPPAATTEPDEPPPAPPSAPTASASRGKIETPRGAPPLTDIDHRTRTKLRRGRLDVDARIDLHGMRQAEAQRALLDFLRRSQAEGAKVAIVVTGKGLGSESGGVLRRMVPMWLEAPNLRDVVVGFGEAARAHGGEGALYVRIRRLGRGA